MARKINKRVEIQNVHFSEDLYPRVQYSWQTAYDYSQSMKTGAKFPPIVLALYKNKLFLVDGKHRLEAMKLLKKELIEAEVYTGWSMRKIFEEAITRNIAHGRVLSPFEKRRIALKLREMKYNPKSICKLIQIPAQKLDEFVGQRLVNAITGETIVKSPLKHLAGSSVSREQKTFIEESSKEIYSKSQISMLDEIIELLENGLMDLTDDKVVERLETIKTLLKQI